MKCKGFIIILSLLVSGIMPGCSFLETVIKGDKQNLGTTDSRIILPAKNEDESAVADLRQRYSSLRDKGINQFRIEKGESITITLQQGFIADFYEWGDRATGEIAVVGRVRELTENTKIGFGKKESEAGRLLYYSGDVAQGYKEDKGQYLNFSSLPFYGPVKYKGGPLLIELYIIEMDDEENKQYQDLMKQLAALGSTAYPPASPVLGVLESLGTALLSGSSNDLEFQYHMALWPASDFKKDKTLSGLYQGYLIESNMVVVKQDHFRPTRLKENQTPAIEKVKWEDLAFNRKSGRLIYKKADKQEESEAGEGGKVTKKNQKNFQNYMQHTYLSFQISKGQDATGSEIAENYFKLGNLIESMDKGATRTAAIDAAITKLKALISK